MVGIIGASTAEAAAATVLLEVAPGEKRSRQCVHLDFPSASAEHGQEKIYPWQQLQLAQAGNMSSLPVATGRLATAVGPSLALLVLDDGSAVASAS